MQRLQCSHLHPLIILLFLTKNIPIVHTVLELKIFLLYLSTSSNDLPSAAIGRIFRFSNSEFVCSSRLIIEGKSNKMNINLLTLSYIRCLQLLQNGPLFQIYILICELNKIDDFVILTILSTTGSLFAISVARNTFPCPPFPMVSRTRSLPLSKVPEMRYLVSNIISNELNVI